MTTNPTAAELELLCQQVAPADLPSGCYALLRSEMPVEFGSRHAIGYFSTNLDIAAESILRAAGRWTGRRPAVFVDDLAIRLRGDEIANMTDAGFASEWVKTVVTGILWHELAHCIDTEPARLTQSVDRPVSEVRRTFTDWAANPRPVPVVPWLHHTKSFLRICAHLHRRASLLGQETSPGKIVQTWAYCLSPLGQYAAALGDELAAPITASIREIVSSPEPKAFTSIWTGDVTRWLERLEADGETVFAA